MSSGRVNTFAIVVLLFAASAASASPTIISDSPVNSISFSSGCATDVIIDIGHGSGCAQISEFGKVICRPLSYDSQPVQEHSLPAVPPAVAMVLIGFLCISLVRDRRAWLTVLTGLFWIGQIGINALPQLSSRLNRKAYVSQQNISLIDSYALERGHYPDSYNIQARYSGLLYHLAGIPRDTSTSAFSHIRKIVIPSGAEESVLIKEFRSAGKGAQASQHAIVSVSSSLSTLYNCLVSGIRQFVCFTPAFIFSSLPRGPPISQIGLFCKPQGV